MASRINRIGWRNWIPSRCWRIVGTVDSADEIPEYIPRNGVVLVGSVDNPKWIAFDCPCPARHRIMLNLDGNRFPSWRFRVSRVDRLSISPSVSFYDQDRQCHYFIRGGKTVWVREDDDE
jgi:hypothetical protein